MTITLFIFQIIGFLLQTVPCIAVLFHGVAKECMIQSYRDCLKKYLLLLSVLSVVFASTVYGLWHWDLLQYNRVFGDIYMLFAILICLVQTQSCFQMKWKKKFILFLLVMEYEAVIVSANAVLINYIGVRKQELPYNYTSINVPTLFLLTFVLFPFMRYLMRHVVRNNMVDLKGKILERGCIYVGLSVVGYLCIAVIVNQNYTLVNLFAQAVILVSNIVIYVIFFSEIGVEKRRTQLEEQMNLIDLRYQMIQENMELTQRIRHDMRHQLNGLRILYDKKDWEAMGEFLQENDDNLKLLEQNRELCKSPMFDSLFQYYSNYAKSKGISVEMKIRISRDYDFSPVDMSNLIGNGMENAMEATLKVPKEKRYIHLETAEREQKLLIQIKNSCEEMDALDAREWKVSKILLSSKRDFTSYGYGLKSMNEIAEKYGGMISIKQNKDEFITRIVLETE